MAQGPDTYLNGARNGWPHDHSVDETYECPPHTWKPRVPLAANVDAQARNLEAAMKRHPEGTEKLIDTRDQRRKDREARIQRDPKIAQAIRRDQRKLNDSFVHFSHP